MPRATKTKPNDEAMVEAAIAQRTNACKIADDATSCGVSSTNPSVKPSPRSAAEVAVAVAGGTAPSEPAPPPPKAANTPPETVSGGANERRCCSSIGFAFFALLSASDMLLRLAFAGRVATFYGPERAESFWWLLVMQCVAALVGLVYLVARVAAQQTAAGRGLQERLENKRESTVLMLMACMLQPELLRCLLPSDFLFTIVKIDTVASTLAGLPFLGLATSFAVEEQFGDRYGMLRAIARFASSMSNATDVDDAPPGVVGCASVNSSALASPPPSPPPAVPPPPFPPADPSGDTTVLAVWTASFVLFVILVKLVRLTISWQARAQTIELRNELDAERRARAEEYGELMSFREYYYGTDAESAFAGRV